MNIFLHLCKVLALNAQHNVSTSAQTGALLVSNLTSPILAMLHNMSFFPIENPTLIFLVVTLIILLAPIIMGKLRIPHIIGMVLAGVIVGPNGVGLLENDSSFEIFGKVGLYFIMLLAGLEMDINDLRKNTGRALTHGLLAFSIPPLIGIMVNLWVLNYPLITSILLASMYASFTLIAYPTVQKLGISQERSVTIAVGATAITDTLTLLVLATVVGMFSGENNLMFWLLLGGKLLVVFAVIVWVFPRIARSFFKRHEESVSQFVFVVAITFFGAALMELIHMEGLLGAFLTGLVLNRYIPKVSPLMSNLEFVGNAIFIPYFLMAVGMLVNVKLLVSGWGTIEVAAVMISVALSGKFIASCITQRVFKLDRTERNLIFGLSSAQAGATLAAALVGYNLLMPNGQRLLNDDVLNGTILLILVTCICSSFTTQAAGKQLVLRTRDLKPARNTDDGEQMLIPVNYADMDDNLLRTAVMMRNPKAMHPLLLLNVVYEDADMEQNLERGKKLLAHVAQRAQRLHTPATTKLRIATNIAKGIKHTFNEHQASEIIIGMHTHKDVSNRFWGDFHQSLFAAVNKQIVITQILQPLNTLRKMVVAVPSRAEYELGFYRWIERLARFAENLDCKMEFHGRDSALQLIGDYLRSKHPKVRADYTYMAHWNELPQLAGSLNDDQLFVVITARKGTISHKPALERLPEELRQYLSGGNIMIIFPEQYGPTMNLTTIAAPQTQHEKSAYEAMLHWLQKLHPGT